MKNLAHRSSSVNRRTSPQRRDRGSSPKQNFNNLRNSKTNKTNSFSGRRKTDKWANFLVESSACNLMGGTEWVFDTAASHHCCKDKNLFTEYKPLKGEEMAVAIKGVTFPILGKGTIKLKFGQRILYFKDVMHAEKLRRNLISGPKLDMEGISFNGGNGVVNAFSNGQLLFKASLKNGTYRINFRAPNPGNKKVKFQSIETSSVNQETNLDLWHRRCAHVNPRILIRTGKCDSVKGMPNFTQKDFKCEHCKLCKFRRRSFKPISKIRSKRPLELLYADVWGPCRIRGRGGEKYYLSIIDDYSRKTALYPIREKTEVCSIVKNHITRAETFLDLKVKSFRSDNGREFVNNSLDDFFREKGIRHELTNTFTPEQNGVIERFNQTVTDGAKTMISESGLGNEFWPDAMLHFTYTWNRLVHRDDSKTPFELYGNSKPSIRHLKPFGVKAYVGVPRQNRSKLEAKAKKGILIGYAFSTRGYRIWLPEERRVIETINVSFDEISGSRLEGAVLGPTADSARWHPIDSSDESDDDYIEESRVHTPKDFYASSSDEEESDDTDSSQDIDTVVPAPSLKKVRWIRQRKPRKESPRCDIYYYEEGKSQRLRSHQDIEKYCDNNEIEFNPLLFNFKGKDEYEGIVDDTAEAGTSMAQSS
jgi:hypothetical protein